jgi:hypothetical protein
MVGSGPRRRNENETAERLRTRTNVGQRECRGMTSRNHSMQRRAQSANQVCQEVRVNLGLPVVRRTRLIAEPGPINGDSLKICAQAFLQRTHFVSR